MPTNKKYRSSKKQKILRPIHLHISVGTLILIAIGLFLSYNTAQEKAAHANVPAAPSGKTWQLQWSDEFGGGSVDTSKWNVQHASNFGSANHEDQCYQNGNSTVTGGTLRLIAQRQTVNCGSTNPDTGNNTYYYTSGMITTRAQGGPVKYKFTQGYIEARIKAPKGNAFWPAFWLVGPGDSSTPGWPDYGEFDITEIYGSRPDSTFGTFHYKCSAAGSHCKTAPNVYNIKTNSAYGSTSTYGTTMNDQSTFNGYSGGTTDFNTYGFEWNSDTITWYVNGRKVRYLNNNGLYRIEQNGSATREKTLAEMGSPSIPLSTVFNYPHSIILNLAVGGDGPRYSTYGYTGYDTAGGYVNGNLVAENPATMEVDYVRVYQLANVPPVTPPPTTTPNPTTPTPQNPGSPATPGDSTGGTGIGGTSSGGGATGNPQQNNTPGGGANDDGSGAASPGAQTTDQVQSAATAEAEAAAIAAANAPLWKQPWVYITGGSVLGVAALLAIPFTRAILLWPIRRIKYFIIYGR